MKGFMVLILLLFLFTSCQEKNAIEVIPNYDEIYLPLNKVDETPELLEGDEKKLSEKIDEEVKKLNLSVVSLDYKLMIDEDGSVKKVEVVKSPDIKFTNLAVKEFENWKFLPGKVNGKAIKSQYRWYFNYGNLSSGLMEINKEDFKLEVDEMPQPVGGLYAIQEKIIYPEIAKRAGIEGKVLVKCFIDEEGNVVNAEILKGIGSGLDEAAIDAIKQTKFTPAKHKGEKVKVQVVVPILFKLQ